MIPLYGWIPEWPKGADCKSVAIASKVRILPQPYARVAELADAQDLKSCGVTPVPVRFRSRARIFIRTVIQYFLCPDSSVGRAED